MAVRSYFVFISLFQITQAFINLNELTVALNILQQFDIHECVFLSDTGIIFDVHQLAPHIKLISSKNKIASFWDLRTFSDYKFKYQNVRRKKAFIIKRLGIIQDFISEYNIEGKMKDDLWLVFEGDIKLSIPYDCELIKVNQINGNSFKLTEIYSIKNNTFALDFGLWDSSSGLNMENRTIYWRMLNFNESIIISVALDHFHPKNCSKIMDKKRYACKIYEIFEDYAKIMNFQNWQIVGPRDEISQIDEDVALAPILCDPTQMIMKEKIGPLFLRVTNWYIKYPAVTFRSDYYLQPFNQNLWFAIIFLLTLGSGLVVFETLMKNSKSFAAETVFTVFGIFCNQINQDAENISLRIIFLVMNIIGLVIVNSFGAVITSFLSVEIPKIPFKDLEGFVENGQYKLLLAERGILMAYLSQFKRNDPFYRLVVLNYTVNGEVWEGNTYSITKNDDLDRFKKICDDKSLATEGYDHETNDLQVPCAIHKIEKPICKFWIIVPLQHNSPFVESFNINWLRYQEYGIQYKMQKDVDRVTLKFWEKDNFRPVEIEQMTQVLSMPFVGMLVAIGITAFEFVFRYINKIKKM